MTTQQKRFRQLSPTGMVTAVSSVVALCIMGDSLMYSILPLEAAKLGIALPLVGILLSVNRFIRLISNRWAGTAFERYGPRLPFLFSVLLGLISTAFYGLRLGFIIFLFARMAWGIAWSGLRQGGFVSTWTGDPSIRGRLTGLLLGVIRLGSAVGVVLGGALYDRYGFVTSIAVILVIGLAAIPLTLILPWKSATQHTPDVVSPDIEPKTKSNSWQSLTNIAFSKPLHRWLTMSVFFIYMLGGVVVSTTSIYVASQLSSLPETVVISIGVATLTGLLHGARWVTNLLIGPLVGALSDRIGKSNSLLILGVLMIFSILSISLVPPLVAIVVLMLILILDGSLTVVVNATATTIATDTERPHTFMAAFATAADTGSAFGPIIAFSALANTRLPIVYTTGSVILIVCLALFWNTDHRRAFTHHRIR